jgi:hypothetical protein
MTDYFFPHTASPARQKGNGHLAYVTNPEADFPCLATKLSTGRSRFSLNAV